MSSTPRFAHCDTMKRDGCYVQFEQAIVQDDTCERPDDKDEGFWPSQDKDACGYCGDVSDERFAELYAEAEKRMADFDAGEWGFVGVRAVARCLIVRNGMGTYVNIESGGVWGVESDSGRYLQELYEEEIEELKDMLAAMREPIYD